MAITDEYFENYVEATPELVDTEPHVTYTWLPGWRKYRLSTRTGVQPDAATQPYSGFGYESTIERNFRWLGGIFGGGLSPIPTLPLELPFMLTAEVFGDEAETELLWRQVITGNVTITAIEPIGQTHRISAYTFSHTITTDGEPALDNDCPTEYDNGESMPETFESDGFYDFRTITPGTVLGEHYNYTNGVESAYTASIYFHLKSAPYQLELTGAPYVKLSFEYFDLDIISPHYALLGYDLPIYSTIETRKFKLERAVEDDSFHDALTDAAGHTLVARNDGDNVIVEAFPGNAASRELRYTLTGAKNPSIWRDKSNNLYLLTTRRSDGHAIKRRSRDSGRTFT